MEKVYKFVSLYLFPNLRFSEVLNFHPASRPFFNSDVTNSNIRPNIRRVVPLNFQQSFSPLVGEMAAGLLKMVDTPILALIYVTRAILLPLKFMSASWAPQKQGNYSALKVNTSLASIQPYSMYTCYAMHPQVRCNSILHSRKKVNKS